jgi:hypothetical protein
MSQQQPVPEDRTIPGARVEHRDGRSMMVAVLLGLAVVLALGYEWSIARPVSASVSTLDTSPDQSTGPTDPNGPPY